MHKKSEYNFTEGPNFPQNAQILWKSFTVIYLLHASHLAIRKSWVGIWKAEAWTTEISWKQLPP